MTRKTFHLLTVGSLLIFPVRAAMAFKNWEHQAATQIAVSKAASNGAADMNLYSDPVTSWSWGIGVPLFGNPAEQLAHNGDQTVAGYTQNGGPFQTFLNRVFEQYMQFNFDNQSPQQE